MVVLGNPRLLFCKDACIECYVSLPTTSAFGKLLFKLSTEVASATVKFALGKVVRPMIMCLKCIIAGLDYIVLERVIYQRSLLCSFCQTLGTPQWDYRHIHM